MGPISGRSRRRQNKMWLLMPPIGRGHDFSIRGNPCLLFRHSFFFLGLPFPLAWPCPALPCHNKHCDHDSSQQRAWRVRVPVEVQGLAPLSPPQPPRPGSVATFATTNHNVRKSQAFTFAFRHRLARGSGTTSPGRVEQEFVEFGLLLKFECGRRSDFHFWSNKGVVQTARLWRGTGGKRKPDLLCV